MNTYVIDENLLEAVVDILDEMGVEFTCNEDLSISSNENLSLLIDQIVRDLTGN